MYLARAQTENCTWILMQNSSRLIGIDVIKNLRNIAIIAHVDHGKTTLVDQLLQQSGTLGEHAAVLDRVMDSNELEKERGITILSIHRATRILEARLNVS